MKTRRHHNNKGRRQVQRGNTVARAFLLACRLGVPFTFGTDRTAPRGFRVSPDPDVRRSAP